MCLVISSGPPSRLPICLSLSRGVGERVPIKSRGATSLSELISSCCGFEGRSQVSCSRRIAEQASFSCVCPPRATRLVVWVWMAWFLGCSRIAWKPDADYDRHLLLNTSIQGFDFSRRSGRHSCYEIRSSFLVHSTWTYISRSWFSLSKQQDEGRE